MEEPTTRTVSWRLAVTRRCLEDDLNLDGSVDWGDYSDGIPILRAFIERRGQLPEGQERVQELVGRVGAPVWTLHSGDDRGATWYDEDEDVVWLLAVGWSHDYDKFPRLADRGLLLPTLDDYARLDAELPDAFALESLRRDAIRLVLAARDQPGQLVEGVLAGLVSVRVCRELGDPPLLTVAVSERLGEAGEHRLPHQWQLIVAAAFYPGAPFEDLMPPPATIDRTGVRADELALVHFLPEMV